MFLRNLISNTIGGIMVGLTSDKLSHVFAFSLLWVLISFIDLFTFQRKDLTRFDMLVRVQELKYNLKTTLNPKLIWVVITGISAFTISFLIGILIVSIR